MLKAIRVKGKELFHFFFLGHDFLAHLHKPNEFEKSLADSDVHFVCATQKT